MFEKIAESLVALALRFLVWLSENHYTVFCDLQRYIPAGLWEAYVAYLDNEPVVTPAEGLYKPEGTSWDKCEVCQERESFYHAMTLDEMGMFLPESAAGILAKYENADLPYCAHHPAPKPISLEDEHRLEAAHGSL